MPKMVWTRSPDAGGVNIPEGVRQETTRRLEAHAAARWSGKYRRLEVRFRGKLCYVDAYTEAPEAGEPELPLHLCRLRYYGRERWTLAVYTYSHERYETAILPSGDFWGALEEAFEVAAMMYLG